MKEQASFNIHVHNMFYIIKPYLNFEHALYEVFTNCEKLFTLKKNGEGNWVTAENDIIPISESIVEDIGEELEKHELQLNDSTEEM